jgi:hypothetical protein
VTTTDPATGYSAQFQRPRHGHLRLLARAGAVDTAKADKALDIFDQVRAMTWRLLNPNT